MKNTINLITVGTALMLASCANTDPDWKEFKAKKAAEKKAQQDTPITNPYGAPASQSDSAPPLPGGGEFGVPSNNGVTGSVGEPQPQHIPPIPGIGGTNNQPLEVSGGPTMQIPDGSVHSALPTGPTITHTVVSGDTLWGLSKKYNVSVYDIRIANSITTDTIMIGQKILIPQK